MTASSSPNPSSSSSSSPESIPHDRPNEPVYFRPERLVEAAELVNAPAGSFVILDTRPREAFDAGHAPHARWVDHDLWAKSFGDGSDSAGWGERIGALGIDGATPVVVYDEDYRRSGRVWWLLRYWGVADVRLLNGGWTAWRAEGFPAESHASPPTPAKFSARPHREILATKEQILESLAGGSLQIVDARGPKEFHGEDRGKNKRGGSIPGAKHLEWSELIDPTTQKFKPAAAIRERLVQASVALDRPTVAHCQSGARASVTAFGLELVGATNVRNYYASWAEWGNADDTPIASGPAPNQGLARDLPPA